MQKKIIFKCVCIIIFCILLSGCTVDYTLSVNDNSNFKFLENIEILDGTVKNYSLDSVISNVREDYGMYYDVSNIEDVYDDCYFSENDNKNCDIDSLEKIYGILLNKKYYTENDIMESRAINEYFGKIEIDKKGEEYIIKAHANESLGAVITDVNYFSALIDSININIVVPYNVKYHNADSVSFNTYTWTFDKDNYLNKKIEIRYETSSSDSDFSNANNNHSTNTNNNSSNNFLEIKTDDNTWIIIGIIALIVIIGVSSYLIIKKSKNNNI